MKLTDIAEARALLARAKSREPGSAQALASWFEAWGGYILDMFDRLHTPLLHPKRRFCPECGNRSFWPHASWCSGGDGGQTPTADPAETTPAASVVDEVVTWPRALSEAAAVPRNGPLTVERIALLRLYQRSIALAEPDPMVPITSTDLLTLLDAAERSLRVLRALREKADWRQQHGDDPRELRNFADSIDPTSEVYDPNQDPLVSR